MSTIAGPRNNDRALTRTGVRFIGPPHTPAPLRRTDRPAWLMRPFQQAYLDCENWGQSVSSTLPGHQAREYSGDSGRYSEAAGFRYRQANVLEVEAACALGVAVATVKRDLRMARPGCAVVWRAERR